MPLLLREATASDAPALTEIYFSAFSLDPISILVFPRTQSSYTWWETSILEEITDPNAHFLCIYDSSSPSTIVSYAKWNSPSAPFSSELPAWPKGADEEIGNHFFGELMGRHEKIMKGRKHWYLEFVATRPEYQGKGAAGQLLRWGIDRSEEDGVETYLEASPDGLPIYQHFGFQEVERLVIGLEGKGEGVLNETEFTEVFMVRPAMEKKT